MSVRLHAWLAVLVVVGYFVVILAVLVLLPLAGLTMLLSSVWLATLVPVGGYGVIYLGYIALMAAVWRLRSRFSWIRRPKVEPPSVWVIRRTHPELWRMIDELVAATATKAPDEVKVVAVFDAAVRDDARLLGLRRGRRHLVISLPLLAGLTVDELRAALCRELDHFSPGHTGLNAVVHRATVAMRETSSHLTGFFRWAFASYARLFLWVAKPVNDAQELAAEAVSVRTAGEAATLSAVPAKWLSCRTPGHCSGGSISSWHGRHIGHLICCKDFARSWPTRSAAASWLSAATRRSVPGWPPSTR